MKHNFPEDAVIICKHKHNLKQAKEIFHLAIDGDCLIYENTLEIPVDTQYPYFLWENGKITQTFRTKEKYPGDLFVSFEEFKAFLQGKGKYNPPFKQELHLNSQYKAVITKENVTVGCQKFSHDTIKQLYQLSQKALKS